VSAGRSWRLTLAYDGTAYSGWQVQPAAATVQGTVEAALEVLEGQPVSLTGSGRTDAGVHALAQVASCTLCKPIPPNGLLKALNRLLPTDIRVSDASLAPEGFHARHWASAKTYEYRVQRAPICPPFEALYTYWHPYPLDEDAMRLAAERLVGDHDFRSFASSGGDSQESTERSVFSSVLRREDDLLVYRVRGSGFLYRMVRNFVGTLLEVGRGNLEPHDIDRILAARDRRAAGPTAPARGLFLASVEYPAEPAGDDPAPLSSSA